MPAHWRLARSLAALFDEVDSRWPGRSRLTDGSIGNAAHSARKSDHNPNEAGVVCAVDITNCDPDGKDDGSYDDDVAEVIAERIRAAQDPRVKYVIWRGRMFSSYSKSGAPAWTWRPYSGPNGHFSHVHVSVQPDSERYDSTAPWFAPDPDSDPEDEDDMPYTPEQVKAMVSEAVADLVRDYIVPALNTGKGNSVTGHIDPPRPVKVDEDQVRRIVRAELDELRP